MSKEYTFVRDVTPADWSALPRDFANGETIYKFSGHTYGLDRDDMMYLNRETIPCRLSPDEETFFTVPVEFLVDQDGNNPCGDYISSERLAKLVQALNDS